MTTQSEIQALKCDDCARSDSAVSDRGPLAAADPGRRRSRGFRDGMRARRADAPRLLRHGIARLRGRLRSDPAARWSQVFEAAVAEADAMQKSLVVIYLQGGNDGLTASCRTTPTEYAGVQEPRGRTSPACRAPAGQAVGTTAWAAPAAASASRTLVSAPRPPERRPRRRLRQLYGDGSGGAGSDLAIFPAADYKPSNRSHFESPDYWFGARSQLQTGWLGRWLDTYGSPLEPAAGGLARRLALQADPHRRRHPCARSRACTARLRRARASTGDVEPRRSAELAAVPAPRATTPCPLARRVRPHGRRREPARDPHGGAGAGYPPNSGLS